MAKIGSISVKRRCFFLIFRLAKIVPCGYILRTMIYPRSLAIAACGLLVGAARLSYSQDTAAPVHAPPAIATPAPSIDTVLAFDATIKDVTVSNGTPEAQFSFALTNISKEAVTISGVTTSCGCTVAKLPEQPWKLEPGAHGEIHATMNLAGKSGTVAKSLTVNSDKGQKGLIVRTTIQAAPTAAATPGAQPTPGAMASPTAKPVTHVN
jgi:hypothetical protein